MTKVLEGFDPDHASLFDWIHKHPEPQLFSPLEEPQEKAQQWWSEESYEMEQSPEMSGPTFNFLPQRFGILDESWIDGCGEGGFISLVSVL